jgi:polar amino acid transport system substrate-binding protein
MSTSSRTIRAALLALCLGTAAAATHAAPTAALDRIKSAGSMTVGYVDGTPPFSSMGGQAQPVGYTIDLCKRVADAVKAKLGLANLNVKYMPLAPENVLDSVAKGEVDLMCTPTVDTLKRRERVSYSIPVLNGGIGVAVRKDASDTLLRVLNGEAAHSGPTWRATINRGLANHTYAVRQGSVGEDWVRQQIRRLGVIATVVTAKDETEGVQMLLDHKADAFFSERVLIEEAASKSKAADKLMVVNRNFNDQPLALMMARNDDDFRLVVDTALSEYYRSPQFGEQYLRYFGPYEERQAQLFQIYARP